MQPPTTRETQAQSLRFSSRRCSLKNTSRWSIVPSTASTSMAHSPHSPRRQSHRRRRRPPRSASSMVPSARHRDRRRRGAGRARGRPRRRSGRWSRRSRSAAGRPRPAGRPGRARGFEHGHRPADVGSPSRGSARDLGGEVDPRALVAGESLQAIAERCLQLAAKAIVGAARARRACATAPRAAQRAAPCRDQRRDADAAGHQQVVRRVASRARSGSAARRRRAGRPRRAATCERAAAAVSEALDRDALAAVRVGLADER